VLVAIQFYRPHENSSTKPVPHDFLKVEQAPARIAKIFKTSCYDCHSNTTEYAWYDNIAPLSWYVDKHIQRGKFSLNFSQWRTWEPWRRRLFLQGAIMYDIKRDKMPPTGYRFTHPKATLSEIQKEQLQTWIDTIDLMKE